MNVVLNKSSSMNHLLDGHQLCALSSTSSTPRARLRRQRGQLAVPETQSAKQDLQRAQVEAMEIYGNYGKISENKMLFEIVDVTRGAIHY
jgi:hypothetical protein